MCFFLKEKHVPVNPKCKMKLFLSLILLLTFNAIFSQQANTPVLEREVSLIAENMPIEKAFGNISSQADFVFSYNPKVISHAKNVNINAKNKSVRYVLNQMLQENEIEYKVKGKYIILKKKNQEKENVDTRLFEGYIYDSRTGKRLTEASVYDKNLMASAVTDQYGYFSMQVPANTPIKSLQVSKIGYSDTLLISIDDMVKNRNNEATNPIDSLDNKLVRFSFKKILEISLHQKDTSANKKLGFDLHKIKTGWLVPKKLKINAQNISDPVFKSAQFSLIPYLSTNRLMSGVVVNDFSFNATVGYVNGVRLFEAGGLINFVRNDVSYFEAAGIGNIIGGNLTGVQSAGIFNVVSRAEGAQFAGIFNKTNAIEGVQAAGIFNFAKDSATVQLAGIGNVTKSSLLQAAGIYNLGTDVSIMQAAGIFNSARSTDGVQAAGIFNSAKENASVQLAGIWNSSGSSIVQVAGLVNRTDSASGSQIAGLFNKTQSSNHIQIAGLANQSAGDADIQIASIFNRAKHVKTLQFALFNFADTVSGMSIGLFSFIKKGYHKIEFSADETFPYNIAFRLGSQKFHTFLSAGTTRFNRNHLINWGYGLGTSLGNAKKLLFDIDFSSNEVSFNNHFKGSYHWYKFYLGIDKPVFKKISLAAGLSYNVLLSDSKESDYASVSDRMPFYTLSDHDFTNGHNLKTWIGGKVALRFF